MRNGNDGCEKGDDLESDQRNAAGTLASGKRHSDAGRDRRIWEWLSTEY
jgi:hypothetical protein